MPTKIDNIPKVLMKDRGLYKKTNKKREKKCILKKSVLKVISNKRATSSKNRNSNQINRIRIKLANHKPRKNKKTRKSLLSLMKSGHKK